MDYNRVNFELDESKGFAMSNRMYVLKRIGSSYKHHESMKCYDCYYCNAPGESVDHVPPISIAEVYPQYERLKVRSCLQCNRLLSNRLLFTVLSRCEFLHEKYQKKWRKDLEIPIWTTDEIEELEGSLKRKIIVAMKRKKRAEDIIINIENRLNILRGDI